MICSFSALLLIVSMLSVPAFAASKKSNSTSKDNNIYGWDTGIGASSKDIAKEGAYNRRAQKDAKNHNLWGAVKNTFKAAGQGLVNSTGSNAAAHMDADTLKSWEKTAHAEEARKSKTQQAADKKAGAAGTGQNGVTTADADEADAEADAEAEAEDSLGPVSDAFKGFTDAVEKAMGSIQNIVKILETSPQSQYPKAWRWAENVANGFTAVGVSLCVLFFGVGFIRSSGEYVKRRNFEAYLFSFVQLAIAIGLTRWAFPLCSNIVEAGTGIIRTTMTHAGAATAGSASASLAGMQKIADGMGEISLSNIHLFIDLILAKYGIKIMMFVILAFAVARFFKMYIYMAVAPIPMAALAGETTRHQAYSYLKALAGVLLEGLVIVMALTLFTNILMNPSSGEPVVSFFTFKGEDDEQALMAYVDNVIINMLVCTSVVFGADRMVTKAFGI